MYKTAPTRMISRRTSSFRGECADKTWLYRVAVNLCRDHARRECERRRSWARHAEACLEWPFRAVDAEPPAAARASAAAHVLNALRDSDDGTIRLIVHLCFDVGMPQRGIARATGMPRVAVRRKVARIRERALDLFFASEEQARDPRKNGRARRAGR
jgi:DNA-directed RNA polymerase specialized sigma24 family protein